MRPLCCTRKSAVVCDSSAGPGESIRLSIDANAGQTLYVQVKPGSTLQMSDELYTLKVTAIARSE